MKKVIGVITARMASTRLPGKVLQKMADKSVFAHHVERMKHVKGIDGVFLATSIDPKNRKLIEEAERLGCGWYAGAEQDIVDRHIKLCEREKADAVIRVTCDSPIFDIESASRFVEEFKKEYRDYIYVSNMTMIQGTLSELISYNALLEVHKHYRGAAVSMYIKENMDKFNTLGIEIDIDLCRPEYRLTIDEAIDIEMIRHIYEALYKGGPLYLHDVYTWLDDNPQVARMNMHVGIKGCEQQSANLLEKPFYSIVRSGRKYVILDEQKRMVESGDFLDKIFELFPELRKNNLMPRRYSNSEKMLERALKIIPLGSQTFSKSKTQYPYGVSPYFIKKGLGSHVWDVDGNEYIDFINALAAITLGYNDPDVTNAVKAQLEDGTIFSLPHELEIKVAEKIVEMVPCAEMVRFGKNGSDATSGAIRLARAYTKRDHVAVCGYHGWQDWYIGATSRNLGVPQSTRDLTHVFTYNDIDSLNKIFLEYTDNIAAVIMEPMNTTEPKDGFLERVKEMTHKNGAVFIFDETITGFRYANGGAQEYFNVVPDLATFGKGLANGYPVSAVAGKAEIMRLMEEVFFSFTFGGETLSLAAALATMTKLQNMPVIETLWSQGKKIKEGADALIKKYELENILSISGKDCWSFLLFKDTDVYSQWELKTLFLQEVFARGILSVGTHNMSYAHSDDDIKKLLAAYDEVFGILKDAIVNNTLQKLLKAKPLAPLFKIR